MALISKTVLSKEECSRSFYDVVSYPLKKLETDGNIASVDADIINYNQGDLTATERSQQL